MDVVGVMAPYCDPDVRVCSSLYRKAIYHHPRLSSTYFGELNIGAVLGGLTVYMYKYVNTYHFVFSPLGPE